MMLPLMQVINSSHSDEVASIRLSREKGKKKSPRNCDTKREKLLEKKECGIEGMSFFYFSLFFCCRGFKLEQITHTHTV